MPYSGVIYSEVILINVQNADMCSPVDTPANYTKQICKRRNQTYKSCCCLFSRFLINVLSKRRTQNQAFRDFLGTCPLVPRGDG